VRIKSHWHKTDQPKPVEEVAGALGFIGWRIGLNAIDRMEKAGFRFFSNTQRLHVLGEFVAFLVQVADRTVYGELDEDERTRFITAFAKHMAGSWADNYKDIAGGRPSDYKGDFIRLLNDRLSEYAEFGYSEDGPTYGMLRLFGEKVEAVLGGGENRWALEHIVEMEAPDAVRMLRKSLEDLFS
jgi:hypothetical protein